jgi:hypothetical protein
MSVHNPARGNDRPGHLDQWERKAQAQIKGRGQAHGYPYSRFRFFLGWNGLAPPWAMLSGRPSPAEATRPSLGGAHNGRIHCLQLCSAKETTTDGSVFTFEL